MKLVAPPSQNMTHGLDVLLGHIDYIITTVTSLKLTDLILYGLSCFIAEDRSAATNFIDTGTPELRLKQKKKQRAITKVHVEGQSADQSADQLRPAPLGGCWRTGKDSAGTTRTYSHHNRQVTASTPLKKTRRADFEQIFKRHMLKNSETCLPFGSNLHNFQDRFLTVSCLRFRFA
jgi:hypothetical protein